MKKRKYEESHIAIVQLLGNAPKHKEMIENAIYDFCKKKKIKVIVRRVTETVLTNNYEEGPSWMWKLTDGVKKYEMPEVRRIEKFPLGNISAENA